MISFDFEKICQILKRTKKEENELDLLFWLEEYAKLK